MRFSACTVAYTQSYISLQFLQKISVDDRYLVDKMNFLQNLFFSREIHISFMYQFSVQLAILGLVQEYRNVQMFCCNMEFFKYFTGVMFSSLNTSWDTQTCCYYKLWVKFAQINLCFTIISPTTISSDMYSLVIQEAV